MQKSMNATHNHEFSLTCYVKAKKRVENKVIITMYARLPFDVTWELFATNLRSTYDILQPMHELSTTLQEHTRRCIISIRFF